MIPEAAVEAAIALIRTAADQEQSDYTLAPPTLGFDDET